MIARLDNCNKQRYGPNNLNPDKRLDSTALAILHTTELLHFGGQRSFRVWVERVAEVVAALVTELDPVVRRGGAVCNEVRRPFVWVPLDIARRKVRSLLWHPFMLSALRMGRHLELLKLVKMLEVVQIETCRSLPLLIDMKVRYHLCKMMYGLSPRRWAEQQLLLSHPLCI